MPGMAALAIHLQGFLHIYSPVLQAIQRLDQAPWIGARVRESAAGPLLTDSTVRRHNHSKKQSKGIASSLLHQTSAL